MPMPMKKSMEKPRWPSKAGETLLERDATARVSGEGHVKRRYGYVRATVGVLVVLLAPPPWTVVGDGAAVAAQEPQAEAQTWTLPRTPGGHPDMQGHWDGAGTTGSYYIEERLPDPSSPSVTGAAPRMTKSQIIDPPDGRVPYQPWALAQKQENVDQYIDPFANCFPSGVASPGLRAAGTPAHSDSWPRADPL